MTVESMQRFERALTEAAYQTMLEQAASGMVNRSLSSREISHTNRIAQILVADNEKIESLEDAANFVLHTRVPETAFLQADVSKRVQSAIGEKDASYDVASEESEDAKMGVNIFGEVIYPVANRVVGVLSYDGRI